MQPRPAATLVAYNLTYFQPSSVMTTMLLNSVNPMGPQLQLPPTSSCGDVLSFFSFSFPTTSEQEFFEVSRVCENYVSSMLGEAKCKGRYSSSLRQDFVSPLNFGHTRILASWPFHAKHPSSPYESPNELWSSVSIYEPLTHLTPGGSCLCFFQNPLRKPAFRSAA
jgi:hypothetical protein